MPNRPIMDLLYKARIPVLLGRSDTYTVASCIHDLTIKLRPRDTEKINTVVKLIKDYVDLDKIFKGI